ncbi:Fibrocystin-L, partial [Tetrabaena socialis]
MTVAQAEEAAIWLDVFALEQQLPASPLPGHVATAEPQQQLQQQLLQSAAAAADGGGGAASGSNWRLEAARAAIREAGAVLVCLLPPGAGGGHASGGNTSFSSAGLGGASVRYGRPSLDEGAGAPLPPALRRTWCLWELATALRLRGPDAIVLLAPPPPDAPSRPTAAAAVQSPPPPLPWMPYGPSAGRSCLFLGAAALSLSLHRSGASCAADRAALMADMRPPTGGPPAASAAVHASAASTPAELDATEAALRLFVALQPSGYDAELEEHRLRTAPEAAAAARGAPALPGSGPGGCSGGAVAGGGGGSGSCWRLEPLWGLLADGAGPRCVIISSPQDFVTYYPAVSNQWYTAPTWLMWPSAGSPDPSIATDYFAGRFTFHMRINTTGAYAFQFTVDDNCMLYIDGVYAGSRDNRPIRTLLSAGVHSRASSPVVRRFVVTYLEYAGNTNIDLLWDAGDGLGDADSERYMFGATILVNTPAGKPRANLRFNNAEFRQTGQAFRLGRYSIHFHMHGDLAYASYLRGCAIHHTYNRALTIHGSHRVLVQNNTAYNVMGHTFFLEDGIETGNLFEGNLGMSTKASSALLNTDTTPATFWVTNPNNTYRNNVAAGSDAYGFWYRFLDNPEGPSFTRSVCPKFTPLGAFTNNSAHSNIFYGLRVHPEYYPKQDPCNSGTFVQMPAV